MKYPHQQKPFSAMKRNDGIDKFLRNFRLYDRCSNLFESADIRLNDKQFTDLGLALQKRYSILNWQQGGGKSVAGKCFINFIKDKVKNTFVVAPSLAVQLTWKPRLARYGYDFVLVSRFDHFDKIKPGQVVLISFDMVRILERHLKRFIKHRSYKIGLLVDECDELANMSSSRTKAMLNCFRKKKFAMLTTGTIARNNIAEMYPQLELLYNNSVNMICHCETIYKPDDQNIIQRRHNKKAGQRFPPFNAGQELFQYCFNPERSTVFGVKKDSNTLYNSDELKRIIEKTVITRTFADITGEQKYTVQQHQILQNTEERHLYHMLLEKFNEIVYNYYTSTGNDRKENRLRVIRQLSLLIKACSIPHLFPDYPRSKIMPQKFYKVRDLVREWNDEKVAIGTSFVEAAQQYADFLISSFPDRRVFYIDGKVSFANRKKIIAAFERTTNGILISTQQSLKSSVDIPTCDKVICISLQWNLPKIEQWYFRFIRYNSKNKKQVHFVTYADSIENNILALLMAKEKLAEFVKTGEEVSRSEMFKEYGIDQGILTSIIEKSYDEHGQVQLRLTA